MEEDKRRRRALEAGREVLEIYKSERAKKKLNKSIEQASDEESFHKEADNRSLDIRSISNHESILSRDITYSSVSMSEGEGDADLEGLAGRVTELEEMLQGKEAVVEALHAEIDHLRAEAVSPTSSHSQNSNIPYKEVVANYHAKLQEFERAVNQRDNLIEDLTTSLQQALSSRDALLTQISVLNSTQLENTNGENGFDGKLNTLENELDDQKDLVSELTSKLELAHQSIRKLELENDTHSTEITSYKKQIETLNKRIHGDLADSDASARSESVQKQFDQVEKIKKDMKVILDKFAAETAANKEAHIKEKKEITAKYEAELQKLREENQNLETRHAKEMSVFQTQLSQYKRAIDTLKTDLITRKETHAKEKELLTEQIKLHKLQLDEITTKYVASTSVLDSKESIERSLEQALNDAAALRSENESLKFKLDDLSARYSAAQGLIENGQSHERTLSNKIFSLEKSLSRLSGISLTELDETAYQTLDEVSLQYHITKQKLEEKAELEKKLTEKIQNLENLVFQTRIELDSANLAKESFEKQIKDMKNTIDQLKSEIDRDNQDLQARFSADSLDPLFKTPCEFEQEIIELKQNICKRDEQISDYKKKLEELKEENDKLVGESDKLKQGLKKAYAVIEGKLDQTLGLTLGESKLDESAMCLDQSTCSTSSLNLEELLQQQTNYNQVLMKLDSCMKQIKDFENEKAQMLKEIEKRDLKKEELLVSMKQKEEQHREEIRIMKMEATAESQKFQQLLTNFEESHEGLKELRKEMEEKHAKEMEELRTYFEKKCLQMEKQYSEEIFSQQSKKISDNDSETEELTEDLFASDNVDCLSGGDGGGGGDAPPGVLEKEVKPDSQAGRNEVEPKITTDNKIAELTAEYEEKLANLRKQLQEAKDKSGRTALLKAVNQFCQTEYSSTASTQESVNELNKLRADYNRQLKEQVELARVDIVNDLQEKFEAFITVESESDQNWPIEFLQIQNKFTNNAKREIQTLKEQHVLEIKKLKEESNQVINELQEELKKIKSETHESLQSNLLKERDRLHKTCTTLKGLVNQLIEYFAYCEEELNSTLISEAFSKKQYFPRLETNSTFESEQTTVKRVHFAPQSSEIVSILGSDSDLEQLIDSDKDIIKIFKRELDVCMQRMRADSAKILNTSTSSDSESWSTGIGDNPSDKLAETEKHLANFLEENERLKVKVIDLQQRLLIAESKKEIVTEGYGERDDSTLDEFHEDFSDVQDRAKYVLANGSNDTVYLLQLIDDLCRHSEKNIDDLKREKEEVEKEVSLVPSPLPNIQKVRSSKIEVARNKERLHKKFLEDQAVEREKEREESDKRIRELKEKLEKQERENRKKLDEQSTLSPASTTAGSSTLRETDDSVIDVSYAANQIETLQKQIAEQEQAKTELERDYSETLAKAQELKNIIRELESQLQGRCEKEDILNEQIQQLEEIIVAQTRNQQELAEELELVKSGENAQLSDHIGHLQEELRKHQLSSEQLTANSSALKQLRLEIRELQSQLDRKTRELESMHVLGSSLSLSQPSEDVSIREQIDAARCPTPDDPASPPILPLDHVLKLRDTLSKHFRAEDVALKRLKDLDIQLGSLQRQNEELLAEQEILQQTTSDQLFQIETLKARLEQQKQNAPFAQRQMTSKLETQLYEVNDRLEIAERALNDKEVELNEVKAQLERVSRLLLEKETEIVNVVQSENDVMQKLKDRLQILEEDNRVMQAKICLQEKSQMKLPQIIDGVLVEKNEEINYLKEELAKREKQLEIYLSLDEAQLRELVRQNEHQKNSARTLSDILSINSECEEDCEALREAPNFTRSQNVSNFKMPNSVLMHSIQSSTLQHKKDVVDYSHPITETPKVPRLELDDHSSEVLHSNIEISKEESIQMQPQGQVPLARISPTPETDTTHESSMSEDQIHDGFICPRHGRVSNITPQVNETLINEGITHPSVRRIRELEMHLHAVKQELDVKSTALNQRDAELLEIQNNLELLQKNIESLNEDRLYYKAEFEKAKDNESKIQKDFEEVENILKMRNEELEDFKERVKTSENIKFLQEKSKEVTNLNVIISEKDITIKTLQTRVIEVENEIRELYDFKMKFDAYRQEMIECQNEIQRLSDGLNSRDQMIRRLEEMARRNSLSGGSSPSEKDQEIYHLQEYLKFLKSCENNSVKFKEKDKVIRQMSDDSKSLHRALETIQNKMKESGNIVELRKKLKEERKHNVKLTEDNAKLIAEIKLYDPMYVLMNKPTENSRDNIKDNSKNHPRNNSKKNSRNNSMENSNNSMNNSMPRHMRDLANNSMNSSISNSLNNSINPEEDDDEEENQITEMVERELNLSETLDRKLISAFEMENQETLEARDLRHAQLELYQVNKVKDDLEIQREMLKSQISEYENRIMELKSDAEKDSERITKLEEGLSKERHLVRQLQMQLQRERYNVEENKAKDTELISLLRIKLNEALEARDRLTMEQKNLEVINSMKEVPSINIQEEFKKQLLELTEKLEIEERKSEEIQDALKKVEVEKNRIQKKLENAEAEIEKLTNDLEQSDYAKDQLKTGLNKVKEELKIKTKEYEWQKSILKTINDAETKRNHQFISEHKEIKKLRSKLRSAQNVAVDFETYLVCMREQLTDANIRESELTQCIQNQTEKETELNEQLNIAKDEQKKLKKIIADQQNELKIYLRKELDYAEELKREKTTSDKNESPSKMLRKIKDLNFTIERLSQEKVHLYEKIAQLREENERYLDQIRFLESQLSQKVKNSNLAALNKNDSEERLQNFYGKFLRSESRRKALIYQKHYLLCIVAGYQHVEANTLSFLAALTYSQRSYVTQGEHKRNPKVRFKSAVLVLIGIQRMKWLILRWRTGRRIGANVVLGNDERPPNMPSTRQRIAQAGHSPPVRERSAMSGPDYFSQDPYFRRFSDIQQNLHLRVPESNNDNFKSD